jgi:hypothetical protein
VIALVLYIVVGPSSQSSNGTTASRTGSTSTTNAHGSKSSKSRVPSPPPLLVGATTSGALEVIDSSTGAPVRTLTTGVSGDELSVSPDRSTVYFESPVGCMHEIERVQSAGGSPELVATGSVPALSPDGSKLAYVRQPLANTGACQGETGQASAYSLVIRDVASGSETTYPIAPGLTSGSPDPIDHLSWSSNGTQLAVSIKAPQDDQGWAISVIHPSTDEYYFNGTAVPVTGSDASGAFYREGVFERNGDLFVNRLCCAGSGITSSLLVSINPGMGTIDHQVAIGVTTNDHTSLEADSSGHWLLYLSAGELFVSLDGKRPSVLVTGLIAAAW